MSQYDYGTIDPNAKSGTQLAVDLNNWRDALHSGHRGAARPLYAQAGMMWIRETSAEQWDLMLYDGDTDFVLRSVNPTTNQLVAIPQSAVSGLSEIATATDELEGKADDLEVRAGQLETLAGELETKAGELESGFADLGSQVQQLETGKLDADKALGGEGQTWEDVTSSRVHGTTYTNTTDRPILVIIDWATTTATATEVVVGGVSVGRFARIGGSTNNVGNTTFLVPAGQTYGTYDGSYIMDKWAELR